MKILQLIIENFKKLAAVEITPVPPAGHAVEVLFLEMSADDAARVRAHFGAIANAVTAATVIAGGYIAAGGGSAPRIKAPLRGPAG